ncbi:MAG: hypothetical protein ACJ8HI_07180 [Massilia sp.]|jgi:hypothetical protein
MTCEPFCDLCGGNLGHPANGDWTCSKCKADLELRRTAKKRITKAEFEQNFRNDHRLFRLRSRGGGYRYYRRVEGGPRPWTETMGDPVAEMARKLDAGS